MQKICVYCGSNDGSHPGYRALAEEVGTTLAQKDLTLVYGGGGTGLMGATADAALAAGGQVIGVIPRALARKEVLHPEVPDMRIVYSMHERKALMAQLADGFIGLPGGLGTLEEICETLTWAQLGIHAKPCGVVNLHGYYDHLLAHLDRCTEDGFLSERNRALLLVENTVSRLLTRFEEYQPVAAEPILDWDQR